MSKGTSIDVVIPYEAKDNATLAYCVNGCRKKIEGVRRIFVVSSTQPEVFGATYVPEALYPFSIRDISAALQDRASRRTGWYLQQLLKLYAWQVIEDLSTHYLVVDADVIFGRHVRFFDSGKAFLTPGTEYHQPYFDHMQRLLPGLNRVRREWSGISHHMLLSSRLVQSMMDEVEQKHLEPFWLAYLACIDFAHAALSGASEYETYFNYVLANHPDAVVVRPLHWTNLRHLPSAHELATYDFVACHTWYREQQK